MSASIRIVLTCAVFATSICLSASDSAAADHTKDTLKTVKDRVDSGKAVLLDVRELSEWKAGHIKGAKLAPLSSMKDSAGLEKAKKSLPTDKIIYCHCKSGGRCLIATEILKKEGFDIRALKPGYKTLVDAGFPSEK